jgi:hypothetical protein
LRGCTTGACQAMLHGPLSGIKDLHEQISRLSQQATNWKGDLRCSITTIALST